MRIAIIGDGAMGCLLAYALAPHADVCLLSSWPASVAAIAHAGVIYERDGRPEARRVAIFATPAEAAPRDLALILVKSRQTAEAARQAAEVLAPDGWALTLQNGLGNREILVAELGAARVGQAVTALGATLLGPGVVRHAGFGPTVFASAPEAERVRELALLFEAAGLTAEIGGDIEGLVWGKLVVNCGINALTALLRVPNGALAESPSARALLEAAVLEAAQVATACGITLPYADPVAHTLEVIEATASNYSSMLQDVLAGRPTEAAAINGAVACKAQRLGLPTPVNRILADLIDALETTQAARVG